MRLNLSDIEKAVGSSITYNGAAPETLISCVDVDSRRLTEGGVFIATVGERVDGHKFIADVYARGAVLVISGKSPEQVECEHGILADEWGSYLIVEEPLEALKRIAEYYRCSLKIPVVGITGSVGKTSTKEFIAGVLSQKYNVLKTDGNYNNEIGVPLTLLRIREKHTAAVIEMGISDFGEMHILSKMVRPDICVITNIGQCHLEKLKDRDGILRAKTEIFDFMNPDGEVCLNGDDDKLITVKEVKGRRVHYFGISEMPDKEVYAADIVSRGLYGSDARLHLMSGNEISINVSLPGKHMVSNAAAAACVAELLGLSDVQLQRGISSISAVSGRNHLIASERYTLIDDCYNANPVSMKAAIDLLMLADTIKVAILGDMFELGDNSDEMHADMGKYAAALGIDIILCVGEGSRHMYNAAMETAALREAPCRQNIRYYEDRDALVRHIETDRRSIIPDGSTVLIKASHGMHFEKLLQILQ
ncbi:MAG: UDP-N-acetylmuramoyl-tripeptide--D-alanyl-D-alanine ligase [Lachnospiraceae bacterium]|nr:UDP-N-acetylmuramoyl-tripeptide--D-alanyl-D-alanine ligase [Lachnospiraceae bacterium]